MPEYGPRTEAADSLHAMKYRAVGEDFREAMNRVAFGLKDSDRHYHELRQILLHQRFCPGGRIQGAIGASKEVTGYNCFVSGTIADSFVSGGGSIMDRAKEAAATMRMGGGIGYDFSTLRPRGDLITKLQSQSSGPVSFMHIFDAVCLATSSSGHRRGAQMGVLRVDHPDVEEFVRAKQNAHALLGFNISLAVTDEFMEAVEGSKEFELRFNGRVYKTVDAASLWEKIMRSTWDYAEPGVVFIDRINNDNNLWYCETIAATNPSMPAGTMVHCSQGIVPIDQLEDQKFHVKVFDGTWASAKCFLSAEDAEILELDFGGGRTVQCTPEHKWPVLVNGRYVRVTANKLTPGDAIPLNRNENLGHKLRMDLAREDGLMTGLIFGNGSYGQRKDDDRYYISISFNKEDTDLSERAARYFGVNITSREHEDVIQVSRSSSAYEFLVKVGLSLEKDKSSLPSTVWQSNDDFVIGFVDGLFSTDGYIGDAKTSYVNFTNRDANAAREVGILLGFHGISCSMQSSSSYQNGKRYLRTDLRINHNGAKRFATVFNLSSYRKQERLEKLVSIPTRQHETSTHLVLKSVRTVGRGKVWDISVDHEDHVFPTEWCYTGNCSEQPLPPFGACLLGSFNLAKYVKTRPSHPGEVSYYIDTDQLKADIPPVIRGMDNVVDRTRYPLAEQKAEALSKRRMGIGVMGLANALEACGYPYGSTQFLSQMEMLLGIIEYGCYEASSDLAREKGAFPLFDAERYLKGTHIKQFPDYLQERIKYHGMRNSHLTSIAPTGTISMCADNVSGGIEPVFAYSITRQINTPTGPTLVNVEDYGSAFLGIRGQLARDVTAKEHIAVLAVAQRHVDSAVSKTVNMTSDMPWEDFKQLYKTAWSFGCKGCSTFNSDGKRLALLVAQDESIGDAPTASCLVPDPTTGQRECG